jgi:hypothetical protein
MALALVNTATGGGAGGSTTVASAADNHTAGNLLVAVFSGQTAGNAITSITNTAGDTDWTAVPGTPFAGTSNTNYLHIYYVPATLGHATDVVTVTYASSVLQRAIAVFEFSGHDAADPFNAAATGSATTGTAIATSSITLEAAEEVIVAIMETDAGGTPTGTGAFAGNVLVPINFFAAMHGIVTANSAATATGNSSAKWEIFAASFKVAGGAPAATGYLTLPLLGVG